MTGEPEALNPERIIESLMDEAGKSGCPEYEVYMVRRNSTTYAAKHGRIDQVRRNDGLGASLRVLKNGRPGFSYTSVFTRDALQKTVAEALAGADVSDPQPELALADHPKDPWPEVEGPDLDGFGIPVKEKMDQVLGMEAAAKAFDSRIERVRQAELSEAEYTAWLRNSLGLDYRHSGAVFSCGISVKAVHDDLAEMGYEGDFSLKYAALDTAAVARKAAERAVRCLGGRKVKTGTLPVVLENRVVATFLGILSASVMADNVQRGKSLLAGKIGSRVMSEAITVIDDGLYPGGLGTSPADAEGVPARKTLVVEKGTLKSYLYDIPRANIDGTASTGNAGRSLKSPPGVTSTNFILQPGSQSLEKLCAAMGEGLFVTDVMGAHTANPITGDFSLGVSGLWIKNGQPEHPVKGMALAGNILGMFAQASVAGSDLRLFGSTGTPSLLIEGLTLSGL